MSFANFIPEIWAASILENYHAETVLGTITNTDYTKEFKFGDTLHIPIPAAVTIKDYKAAGRKTSPEELGSTEAVVNVDQEKSFDFLIDDVDSAQSAYPLMSIYTQAAARGLVEDSEKHLAKELFTFANSGTHMVDNTKLAKATTWTEAYNVVLKLRSELNKGYVPQADRYLIVNPEFEEALLSDGSKLTAVDTSGDNKGLREATVGRLLGFNVLTSPFVGEGTAAGKPLALALYAPAFVFVSQLQKMESLRASGSIADRVRGLHVYGSKIVNPDAVAGWVTKTV